MTKTILVVDDNKSIQITIKHLLESEGFAVLVADHGREGLILLRRMVPPCAVLLDIQMPEMDGYEFLRQKEADPAIASIPVVVLSATATADEEALRSAADFIKKPFEIPRLLSAVEKYCG